MPVFIRHIVGVLSFFPSDNPGSEAPLEIEYPKWTSNLLIEDDPLTREALAYILEVEGYYVTAAQDGKKGLELLHTFPRPSAVLLDLGLPSVDGYEFLRRQKHDPAVADVRVFVISAVYAPSVPEATAVLPKPLDLPKLMSLLSTRRDSERGH